MVEKEKLMKQFRSTIIIFIIFIGFTGYYFLVEKKKTKVVEEKKIYIFDYNKDDINTLEFTDMSDGSSIILKKDKDWKIEKPVEIQASKNTVEGIISELAVLSADRDITGNMQNLKKYSLDVPKFKIKFSIGNVSQVLFVGIKNPTEDLYFVKVEGKDNIYTANVSSVDKFIGKKIADLRDKDILKVTENEIQNIDLDLKNKGKMSIKKNNEGKWIINTADKKDLSSEIQNVIDELTSLSIEEFVEKGPSDQKDLGLEKPYYSVKVYKKQGDPVSINFGKIENNLVYTVKNNENNIFRIRRNIIDSIENLYVNMKGKQDISGTSKVPKKNIGEKNEH
jgi:hypothetical protein